MPADLIYALQFQDLIEIQTISAQTESETIGKDDNDATVAFNLYCDELRLNASITTDHHFAEAVGEAEDPNTILDSNQQSTTPFFDQTLAQLGSSRGDPGSEGVDSTDGGASNEMCVACRTTPRTQWPIHVGTSTVAKTLFSFSNSL